MTRGLYSGRPRGTTAFASLRLVVGLRRLWRAVLRELEPYAAPILNRMSR